MAYNFVMVTLSLAFLDPNPTAAGSIFFEVNDFVWDTTTGALVIVPPIVLTSAGGFIGEPIQIPFLAMDSNSISSNWSWVLSAELAGRDVPLPRRELTIKLANGAQQNFKDIVLASTIVA